MSRAIVSFLSTGDQLLHTRKKSACPGALQPQSSPPLDRCIEHGEIFPASARHSVDRFDCRAALEMHPILFRLSNLVSNDGELGPVEYVPVSGQCDSIKMRTGPTDATSHQSRDDSLPQSRDTTSYNRQVNDKEKPGKSLERTSNQSATSCVS